MSLKMVLLALASQTPTSLTHLPGVSGIQSFSIGLQIKVKRKDMQIAQQMTKEATAITCFLKPG